jgi:hypothetical protein
MNFQFFWSIQPKSGYTVDSTVEVYRYIDRLSYPWIYRTVDARNMKLDLKIHRPTPIAPL